MSARAALSTAHLTRRCSQHLSVTAPLRSRRAVVSTTITASPALCTSHCTYFWPYPDNFVPAGATTSSFQSSPVPSVRERIVREYALSPLFGRRTPCCVLGFADSAADVVEVKGELRRCLALALGKAEAEIELGPLQQMKEMLLHRSGTSESPRLADGAWSGPEAELRRTTRYARLPVQARTLVEVYLPSEEGAEYGGGGGGGGATTVEKDAAEEDDTEAAVLAHGWFLQERLCQYMSASSSPTATAADGAGVSAVHTSEDEVEASIACLHDELGVVYCEVPALDESGFLFDQLHGKEVDGETAARVVDRWTRRVVQQQDEPAKPSS